MITIKLSTPFPEWPLLRQTPSSSGIWGDCIFSLNQSIRECDFWVVYDDILEPERIFCNQQNTILITAEPPSIKKYSTKFLRQFSTVVSCHRNIAHPHVIYSQTALPWHVGRKCINHVNQSFTKDYDELKSIKAFNKNKLISVICSNKDFTEGHKQRLNFVKQLSAYFGEKIDVYGRGIKEIEDKWDVIAEYKYHVVLENSSFPDYWTEKLSDSFLGGSYPFYYGCPNLAEYFPKDSFTLIDINDTNQSIAIIKNMILNQKYEYSLEAIQEARDLILDKYNLFPTIAQIISKFHSELDFTNKTIVSLKPEGNFNRAKNLLSFVKKIKNELDAYFSNQVLGNK